MRKCFRAFLACLLVLSAAAAGGIVPTVSSLPASQSSSMSAPIVVGWGGSRLEEDSTYDQSNPSSDVFLGEQASNQEMQVRRLRDLGLNAIRVSFQSACSSWQEMGPYNSTSLERSVTIAQHYGFWIIVDYHGFDDLAGSSGTDCWLSFWRPVVQEFATRYGQIIWEPINEPTGFGDDVPYLSAQYQRWVNQARSVGDNHWIVIQNLCSYGCGLSDWADGFSTVTDSSNKLFISLHSYMAYNEYSSSWENATADAVAQRNYQAVLDGVSRTGWPALNTEGGADELCDGCAPDEVLTGSAGYTRTTLRFIQTLTSLYDSHVPQRMNWLWWAMGSWTDTPGAGVFGSLAPDGWGSLLQYQEIGQPPTQPPTTPGATNTTLVTGIFLIVLVLIAATFLVHRKIRSRSKR